MQIKIIKKKSKDELGDMLRALGEKHGTLASLSQKVSINKCTSGNDMAELLVWRCLKDGGDYSEEIVFENGELFDTLSPRRAELMEYLSKNSVGSIKELADALHRNYKNVYDDIRSLVDFELVDLIPSGRSIKPLCSVKKIEAVFEE